MTEPSASPDSAPNLVQRLAACGPSPSGDDVFDVFVEWVAERGIALYPAQEEAILELLSDRHVILETPTGSGKSLVALALHLIGLAKGARSFYTSPIKALVSEKFFDLCAAFGADKVGLMTGDATVNRDAPVICCTAEILANMTLRAGEQAAADFVVMDEFHYYGDRDRGWAWQLPLIGLPHATFLLMSATLGDTTKIEESVAAFTEREIVKVRSGKRPVPLEFSYSEEPLLETLHALVSRNRQPIYLVHFTQREAAEQVQGLMSVDFATRATKEAIARELKGFRFDTPYGKDMERFVRHGLGLHHGGLLPKYRLMVERLSRMGLLSVICGTDTLGVGVNVPIRTVMFTQLCKFSGDKVGVLGVREFKQIAGRAGRKGFDDHGYVVAQAPEHVIENKRLEKKAADTGRKKFVKKQPPKKGYVAWNEETFQQLIDSPPETLESRFRVTHGMIVDLLQREDNAYVPGGGYRRLIALIGRCHEAAGAKSRLRKDARQLVKSLMRSGVVEAVPASFGRGQSLVVKEALQREFSLTQTLSLFVVEALAAFPPERPDYALDVVTLVEAILEHPRAILARQEDKLKTEAMARMKAEGVEYEERIAALEKISYPKPHAELLYALLDAFVERHPWLQGENVRPKSIMRDMVERWMSFNEYVKELGLERMEGVLLRYLSQGFKVLVQTVPDEAKTDEVIDVVAYFRTTLGRVDSSLVQEWERMVVGEAAEAGPGQAPPPLDISRDKRTFYARIRAELHALMKALSEQDWEEAAATVAQDPEAEEGEGWDAARFREALEPFVEEYGAVAFDHRARHADKTRITPDGRLRWTVTQLLSDREGETGWAVEAVVDLREDQAPEGPLVRVLRIEG